MYNSFKGIMLFKREVGDSSVLITGFQVSLKLVSETNHLWLYWDNLISGPQGTVFFYWSQSSIFLSPDCCVSIKTISFFSCCSCSVAQSCLTLCDPMDCSMPNFPVLHHFPEFVQTHVHWINDANQPSHPLSSPSSLAFSLSQHQGLFQWVSALHQGAKVLELQLQHQSFQWIFMVDFL